MQGDPGSTRFMISLQDEIFQKFNFYTEWAVQLISRITNDEDIPIEGGTIVKQVKLLALQINAEKYYFSIRKSLVEFDKVLEVQRKHVYDLRQLILAGDGESSSEHIFQYMQAVVDEIILGCVDVHKNPSSWNLRKILKEFRHLGGKLLNDSFEGITEIVLLKSLSEYDASPSVNFDCSFPPDLPRPPNVFRGIRRKTSSLRRWLTICGDDSIVDGRYRLSINLLRNYFGNFFIASYIHAIEASGYNVTYVKELRAAIIKTLDCFWRDHLVNMNRLSSAVNVRSFGHRNSLEEYKIDGCRFFISMLSAFRRLTVESMFRFWASPTELEELFSS